MSKKKVKVKKARNMRNVNFTIVGDDIESLTGILECLEGIFGSSNIASIHIGSMYEDHDY